MTVARPAHPCSPTCRTTAGIATAAASSSNGNGAPPPPQQAASGGYRQPPKEILDIVDAPPQPALTFSPDRSLILQMTR